MGDRGLPNERRCCVNHHWSGELVPREAVAHCSTSHAEESRSGKAIEESGHEGSGHVLRYGARNQPNKKEAVGNDIDRSAAVKLVSD